VIGHGRSKVSDNDALSFSETLYRALGSGRSLDDSFKTAKLASNPFYLYARNFNPEQFFLPVPRQSAEHLTRREPSGAAEQLHMPYAEDECEEVSPSDVLVHGRGSIEEVLEVLRDVRSVQQASGRGGIARKFDSPNEFEELVKRVRDARATVVLRKLFLYRGMRRDPAQCSVMQEIWIKDKNNPDAVNNPFKSYAVAHVHHHCQRRVDRIEDIKPEHLAIVDSINARHICDSGGKYQRDNPFFDTYIEPSGGDTLKVFPDGEWKCSKCGQKNLQKRASCRGWRGASCDGIRPCKAWKWGADAGSDAGLAQILKAADETLQWPSGAGKCMARAAGDSRDSSAQALSLSLSLSLLSSPLFVFLFLSYRP
jgi:hypothetical protein